MTSDRKLRASREKKRQAEVDLVGGVHVEHPPLTGLACSDPYTRVSALILSRHTALIQTPVEQLTYMRF